MSFSAFAKSEVRALSKVLKAAGRKLPKRGYCHVLSDVLAQKLGYREVCRDGRTAVGLYPVGFIYSKDKIYR